MARFFFSLHVDRAYPDLDGIELPGLSQARAVALRCLTEMLKERAADFWAAKDAVLTVTDAEGLTLFTLTTFAVEAPAILGGAVSGGLPIRPSKLSA